MQKIKYSFVLPAYKARFFREALDSILAQTYKDFELIIVNDASPEDLDSIVKSCDDPRIRYYVNEQNIGGKDLVAQWNHCLEYAEGDYIILASDDDVYFPQYLEKMDALVQKYPEVNVFRPRIQYIDENGNVWKESGVCEEKVSAIGYLEGFLNGSIDSGIPFYVFNKVVLQKNGGFVNFPLAWGADNATVMLMSRNGMCISNEYLFAFRMSGDNISMVNIYDVIKTKLYSEIQSYKFTIEYINNLTNKKETVKILKRHLDRLHRSLTAAELNSMTFVDAIKITPELFRLPWATPNFIFKRVLKKFLQLLPLII